MNSHQATYETALERLERRMAEYNAEAAKRDAERGAEAAKRNAEAAKRDAERGAEAAKRNAEAAKRDAERNAEFAKRDKDNLRWQIGMWVAAVVVIGVLIRWPG